VDVAASILERRHPFNTMVDQLNALPVKVKRVARE